MNINHATADLELTCSSCGEMTTHEVTYSNEPVHHLRCCECRVVSAYLIVVLEDSVAGRKRKYAKVSAVLQDHAALMRHRGSQELHAYQITGTYAHGQYIAHNKYGEGYILDVLGPPMKMQVLFADKKRLHVCGSASIASAQPTTRMERHNKPAKPRRPKKVPEKSRVA